MDNLMGDAMMRVKKNPLIMMNPNYFEKEIFPIDKRFAENCRAIRSLIHKIIKERRAEKDSTKNDVLAMLITDEYYNDDENLVDDIIIMFFAGSKTVQSVTSTLFVNMIHEPEAYIMLRAEIDAYMEKVKDDIMTKMTREGVDELEYVKMAYSETMRRDAPAGMTKI